MADKWTPAFVDGLFEGRETAVARDLKVNLQRLLSTSSLQAEESLPVLAALAASAGHLPLLEQARQALREIGTPEEGVREAEEAGAIMGMLNIYYRFKHMIGSDMELGPAGLRMTSLARPVLGKERFEMAAFAVSVLNGCEDCIRSHNKVLKEAGVGPEKVHDLARLAAVVAGIRALR